MDGIQRLVVVHSPSSTRAKQYSHVRTDLQKFAGLRCWPILELALDNTPYYQAIKYIAGQLLDGDLLVSAGGDGVAQVSFQAIYVSHKSVVMATIPLGNGNDISRALNGRRTAVSSILNQSAIDFYPLNVVIDGHIALSLLSYVTFGATTVLVDYLNCLEARRARRVLKHLSPAAAVPLTQLNRISRKINTLDFPDFLRDGQIMADDSIGFFVIPAAHNVLRLPKKLVLAKSEFFFHHATTKDKGLLKKIIMAGAWTIHFPGETTDLEELDFGDNSVDIIANVSGDNINLGPVKRMSAIRSTRPVKIMANNQAVC